MAKTEKTKAELYREERKQRIAKANKKNAKSIEAGKTVAGIVKKIVAVVLIIAVICGLGAWCNATTGFVNKLATAVKVGDAKVNAVLYKYYYSNMYQQTAYYAQMYSQYGMDMGYNSSLSPDDPSNTTTDEDGNEITWAEYFRTSAVDRAQYVEAFYAKAMEDGFELGEDHNAEIEETIENYRTNAADNGYSLNGYLKASFGAGFNERVFKKQLIKEEIASHYAEHLKEQYAEDVTMDQIHEEYDENSKNYDYADIHYYKFAGEVLTAEDGETDKDLAARQKEANEEIYADAEDVYASVSDLASLEAALKDYLAADEEETEEADTAAETEETAEEAEEEVTNTTELKTSTYESISAAVGEKGADWVYGNRKAGDKTLIKDDSNAYIIIVDKPAYQGNSVDVRHCLISFNAEDEENVTEEEKKAALDTAEKLLKEWKAGDATEETFAEMATNNTGDEASAESGGLYAGMRITDSYQAEFLNWSFDSSRKEGDTGIIETTYGYHIMYFSKNNKDDIDQYDVIRTNIADEKYTEYEEKLVADDGEFVPVVSDFWTKRVMNSFCKTIKTNLAYSS